MDARDSLPVAPGKIRVLLGTSNQGKLREYRELAEGSPLELALIPNFNDIPLFDESAPTFAENAAGKALHYSRYTPEILLADDSGLVVNALGGEPGVQSARYAGPDATSEQRVQKLLNEIEKQGSGDRRARFVCVIALARQGRTLAVFSDFVEGTIATEPHGTGGFGYDPVFFVPELGRTFAESAAIEKNYYSHRGRAFRKALRFLCPA